VVGRKDGFGKTSAYAGRVYSFYKGSPGVEIISVEVELMCENPIRFAKAEPQYFDLIVKVLKGL
jgi:hypothetical protein